MILGPCVPSMTEVVVEQPAERYRIRERFFNIWYLMRYGKKQHREEVLWLVRFLESWCNQKELELQASEQIEAMKGEGYSTYAAYFKTLALYHARGISSKKKLHLPFAISMLHLIKVFSSNVF